MEGQQSTPVYDCIVVGAGYSGLAAAKLLKESSRSVLVLEANDRVGGRAKTIHLPDGGYWDVGGSFLGLHQDRMYELAKEYDVPLYTVPTEGKLVLAHRGQAKAYSGLIPPLRPWEVLDCGLFLWKFDKLCKTANVEEPWCTPNAAELDRTTLWDWIRRNTWTKAGRMSIDMAMQITLGQTPECCSILHAIFYYRAAGSLDASLSSENGLQKDLMKGGAMAIPEKIQRALGDEVVRLGHAVKVVKYDEEGCEVVTVKGTYRARRVIFAIPQPLLLKVEFNPPLPTEKTKLLQHMPMGSYGKVFATYKTAFWRNRGLRGECLSISGYVSVAFDVTPPSGGVARLMGILGGSKAGEFNEFSEEKQRRIALEEFAAFFGKEALEPEAFFYHSMINEEWISGCPVATPAPGMWTRYGEWMRKPIGPLHWAGTETSTKFYGYMDGAVDAGRRAAREVIAISKRLDPDPPTSTTQ